MGKKLVIGLAAGAVTGGIVAAVIISRRVKQHTRAVATLGNLLAPLTASQVTSGWGSDRTYRCHNACGGLGAKAGCPCLDAPKHEGLDFTAAVGTKVGAMAAGKVVLVVTSSTTPAGRYVRIDHGGGMVTEYLHLSSVIVKQGQQIVAGQVLGFTGTSGMHGDGSVVPHLHLTIRLSGPALALYKSSFGTPRTGLGSTNRGGTAVPGEPLVPARYSSSVIAASGAAGVASVRAA